MPPRCFEFSVAVGGHLQGLVAVTLTPPRATACVPVRYNWRYIFPFCVLLPFLLRLISEIVCQWNAVSL